ncbi:MAG TPA: hypothetical protein VH540_08270 [Ktedonobacterales bacterium]|jgi:uncharacterized protein (DUF2267 family)
MDELINQITQRTGISQNQAQQALQVTVNFLKQRLPPQVGSQLENYISGQSGKGMGGMGQQAQGMFGSDQPGTTPR